MRAFTTTGVMACLGLAGCALPFGLEAAGFIEDAQGRLTLRNYYFNDGYRDGGDDRREWAQGFLLDLQSGFTQGRLGLGVDVLGLSGVRLDSGRGREGTGLLPVHDDGRAAKEFGSLGVTAKARFDDLLVKSGTLLPKTPVLVYNDGRLLPQTFRGTQVEYRGFDRLYLHAGHLDQFKARNSTDSVDIFPQGYTGNQGTDFDFAGATFTPSKQLSLTSYYGEMREFYRQQFFGMVHRQPLEIGSLTSDLRYFMSSDAGAARNGEVDADMFSGLFTYALGGHSVGLGYQKLWGDTALPYASVSTVYSFSNASVSKFIQAGEQTWMLRYDYDFAAQGIPGLSLMVRYYKGDHGVYKDQAAREHETNTNLKYVVQSGPLRGLGTELRHSVSRSTYAADRDNYRLYFSYAFALW
ncbi:OprD family porin [Pseudomonas sp. MT3]